MRVSGRLRVWSCRIACRAIFSLDRILEIATILSLGGQCLPPPLPKPMIEYRFVFSTGAMQDLRLLLLVCFVMLLSSWGGGTEAATALSTAFFSEPTLTSSPERQSMAATKHRYLGQSTDSLPPLRMTPLSFDGYAIGYTSTDSAPNAPHVSRSDQPWNGSTAGAWRWTLFPDGQIFPTLLAGVNESRLGGVWNYDRDQRWMWDITLGGRAPLVRYGNKSVLQPEGWQLDIEGSVHLRLDMENQTEMDSNDFRFGLPISYGTHDWQIRFGYYHVSSHMGDERMLRLADQGLPHNRINYVREALIFGYACRIRPSVRLYAEADLAIKQGECTERWHFQFGAEYSEEYRRPYRDKAFGDSDWHGSPFVAVNVILLEEHKFDGNITTQFGWQWRGPRNQLLRVGAQYFAGVSEQYEHIHAQREHKIGVGLWHDF